MEETRELTLPDFLHWLPMLTRQPNPEGKGEVTLYDLMINALRQRPDIMLVGEVRTKKDAETLFEAIHTGHAVYGTVHADNAQDTVIRMTNPPIEVPKLMMNAFGRRRHPIQAQEARHKEGARVRGDDQDGRHKRGVQVGHAQRHVLADLRDSEAQRDDIALRRIHQGGADHRTWRRRARSSNWMVKNNVIDVDAAGFVVANYYKNREKVMEMVRAGPALLPRADGEGVGVAEGTDYENALAIIGTAGASQVGLGRVAIDLDEVLSNRISIRRVDYAEVRGLLDSLEAKKAEEAAEASSKQKVQKDVELGRRIVGRGVSGAEKGLGMAASLLGKEFGESSKGRAIAAGAARGLSRAVRSVEKEFGKAVQRDSGKVGANALVMPRLSLQDQLSELEKIDEGLGGGAFSEDQKKMIVSEIEGMDAIAHKEDASGAVEDQKELVALRARRISDIKSKLNIK